MYIFTECDKPDEDFMESNVKSHIFQSSLWAKFKKDWKSVYIKGCTESGSTVLSCYLLLRKLPLNINMGYIPRGFVCDYSNKELLLSFTDFLKSVEKHYNIDFITVDPDIPLYKNWAFDKKGRDIKNNLIKLGYVENRSFNFDTIQPSYVFRLKLENQNEIFDKFSQKTRYNIKLAVERGLIVEKYTKENLNDEILDEFYSLMVKTGIRDNFVIRSREYFKNMICFLYPNCTLYMVKYDGNADYDFYSRKITNLKLEIEKCRDRERLSSLISDNNEEKQRKKMLKHMEELNKSLTSAEEKLKHIEQYKDKDIYISAAIYLCYGNKAWYLYGASDNILRDTMPNFLMQWQMIKDSIVSGYEIYDFRGVPGTLDESNPLYGLYKFKKGFRGDFTEFIGEYNLIRNKFYYYIFSRMFPLFKRIRNIFYKRK